MISGAAIGYLVSAINIAYLVRLYFKCQTGAVCIVWSIITPCLLIFLMLTSTRAFFLTLEPFEAVEIVLFNICIVLVTSYYYLPIGLFESINTEWPVARVNFYLRVFYAWTVLAVIAKLIFLFGFGNVQFVSLFFT